MHYACVEACLTLHMLIHESVISVEFNESWIWGGGASTSDLSTLFPG